MKYGLSILGNSKCVVMSCVDIKDVYHSIPLTEKEQRKLWYLYLILGVQSIDMNYCQWVLLVPLRV